MVAMCAVLVGSAATSASGTTFVRTHNGLAWQGTIMAGAGDPATVSLSGLGHINCSSSSFHADIGASGGFSVTGKLTALTFTSCTDSVPTIEFTGCHLHNGGVPTVHIAAAGGSPGGGTVVLNNTLMRCGVAGSTQGCYYHSVSATGTWSNVNSSLRFSGVSLSHSAMGTTDDLGAVCGNAGTWNVLFTDLTGGTSGSTLTVTTT
jgi:hypothetical protein